ncbi:MAG: polysaccharide biosynthesis/export family protein [bacterium]
MIKSNRSILSSIMFVLVLSSVLCAQAGKPADQKVEHKLRPGDKIQVRIPAEVQLSGEYEVMPNGKFYFPVLEGFDPGSVQVEGLTVSEVEEKIRNMLVKYYADPTVTVEVMQAGVMLATMVSIYSPGGASGNFHYQEGMRLLDLLIMAGSFSSEANLHKVALFRGDDVTYYDISDLVQGRDLTNNIPLKEGDYFIIPSIVEYTKMRVIVLGQVASPGTHFLAEGSQALDAIAVAGGTVGRAAVGKTYIIRVEDGKPVTIPVDIKALITRADIVENQKLRNGDVVFVPETSRVDIRRIMSDLINLNILKNLSE